MNQKFTVSEVKSLLEESSDWVQIGDDLNKECSEFPGKYDVICQAELFIQKKIYQLKLSLEQQKAEVEIDIRKNPDKYGIDKINEGLVKAALATDEDLAKIQKSFNGWELLLKEIRSRMNSMSMKKSMLRNLSFLHHANEDGTEV